MSRIKLSIKDNSSYGLTDHFLLPDLGDNTDLVCAALAKAQKVNEKSVGGSYLEADKFLVIDPIAPLKVQVITDESCVLGRKQFAELDAEAKEKAAEKAAKEAAKSKLEAAAMA